MKTSDWFALFWYQFNAGILLAATKVIDSKPGQMSLLGDAPKTDPPTEAVPTKVRMSAGELRTMELLRRIYPKGLTSLEASELLHEHIWTVSPRFRKMERRGLVIEAGIKKNPLTGKNMTVWRAKRP